MRAPPHGVAGEAGRTALRPPPDHPPVTDARRHTDVRLRLGAVRLPALPEILLKLMALYRQDDAPMSAFVALIEQDAAMTAKVMAVANSAAYRLRGPQQHLERALQVLGTEAVKTLVISQSIFQAFHGLPELRRVDLGPFWQHALAAGCAAREAARHLAYPREDEAYLAGLLHDIGRLALLVASPDQALDTFLAADDRALCEAERRRLEVSHAEAGAWLIDRWRLDDFMADSVRYHHEPLPRLAATHPLIRIVAFAHAVADAAPGAAAPIEAGALCGMTPSQVGEVVERARAKLVVNAEQLGLALAEPGAAPRPPVSADRLRDELAPLMVAATVLRELPAQAAEGERLQRLADAARIVFQFAEVVVMLPEPGGQWLRWVGAALPSPPAALPTQWLEFSLPCATGTRIGDGLAAREAVFVDRAEAPAALSVAEDQLLRLLGADQALLLPLVLGLPSTGTARTAALVCAGDAALIDGLRARRGFMAAFMQQAEALQARAERVGAWMARERSELSAQHLRTARDLLHEAGNPLSIIQNYLLLLDARLGQAGAAPDPAAEITAIGADLAVLQQEVARVGRLLQAFVRPGVAPPPGSVDVNRLIADVVHLFSRSIPPGVRIDLRAHGHDGAPHAQVPRDALEQVLVNLVKNAVEALGGGDATHAADAAPTGGGRVVVANNGLVNRDGRLLLELSVRDDGPGLPAEVLTQLGQAAGVSLDEATAPARGRGLAIVGRLVADIGAQWQVRSSPIGTSVDLFLPQAPQS